MESSEATGIRWDVCVDGSDAAREAFDTVFRQLMKEGDHLTIAHVYSNTKDDYRKNLYRSLVMKCGNFGH